MAAKKAPPKPAATLRTADGLHVDIAAGPVLDRTALAWTYIARHRVRLEGSSAAREDLAERSAKALHSLGVGPDAMKAIAASGLVEVSVPYSPEHDNWPARIMPWEGLLASAARSVSTAAPLVVRHLACRRTKPHAPRGGQKAAVVLGAVRALGDYYTFDTERMVATGALGAKAVHVDDPTPKLLKRRIAATSPAVVHVGGMDVHQGSDYFDLGPIERFDDGMVLVDEKGELVAVPALELAQTLTAGKKKPQLVAFNLYYSAARIAALTVAEGAEVAVGFQDRCDDLAAEAFLGELYRAWQASGDPLVSLYIAWSGVAQSSEWTVRGLVMWSARPLVTMGLKELSQKAEAVRRRLESKRAQRKTFASTREAVNALNVQVKPLERLNYALLHNRRPMFEEFDLRNLDERRSIPDVRVEVELFAGTERLPYCATFSVDNTPLSARDKIFIPLTSTLVRSLKESVRASLRVRVSVGELAGVREDSYRVTLLPTDEWVDSDEDRQWLPSFVLPQDPAVERVLALARPLLMFLTDTASAGFDGYQSVDPEAEDPAQGVDWQVEAIWSALVALPLGYINPPPTYTDQSQRLRFPSRILRSGDGTCIDLALLFAACLEQVNIYPVVFLLQDHAFPGYWRSEEAWDEFISMRQIEGLSLEEIEQVTRESGTVDQEYAWAFPSSFHAEIMKQIEDGNLVPLETVWITTHSKFAEAQDTGWENLLNASEFEGLIDITLARQNDVTPLPSREQDA